MTHVIGRREQSRDTRATGAKGARRLEDRDGADWSEEALNEPLIGGGPDALRWGDSHHPALSETDGKYDGRFLYISDRAHGRIGMVDLADFRTKQVLQVPNIQTSHGGIFATPDTKYVHIASKIPALKGWDAQKGGRVTLNDHLNHFPDLYRGYSTFLKIDQKTGHMVVRSRDRSAGRKRRGALTPLRLFVPRRSSSAQAVDVDSIKHDA